MKNPWGTVYQPPTNPLARAALVLAGIGVLALSFVLGLFILAIAMGLALVGLVVVLFRRWFQLGRSRPQADDSLKVEYRVVRRERRDQD